MAIQLDKLADMKKVGLVVMAVAVVGLYVIAQTANDGSFKLALPDHRGQLSWSAGGFKIIESSAKPNGREMGIRGKDESGRLTFLGFLFLLPEQSPLTSAKCREAVLEPEKRRNKTLKVLATSDTAWAQSPPVSLVSYTSEGRSGKTAYMVRGFVATGDICGDLEIYSDSPITAEDTNVAKIFSSYRLDENYSPKFGDVFLYAQVLYRASMYKAAAPVFEAALVKLKDDPDSAAGMMRDAKTATRVVTDQAGMAYGMSGDLRKARSLFESAIAGDPDYPMYYYNLACADAEEKNLEGARKHLQQAFARKANVVSGEAMPDPTKDDSFLPYRDNKEFWVFLESLQAKQ
jgi:tetratricopeptide (TPR) repeat protein